MEYTNETTQIEFITDIVVDQSPDDEETKLAQPSPVLQAPDRVSTSPSGLPSGSEAT